MRRLTMSAAMLTVVVAGLSCIHVDVAVKPVEIRGVFDLNIHRVADPTSGPATAQAPVDDILGVTRPASRAVVVPSPTTIP